MSAKKTAAQKGYRKTEKKKPFLTKGELIGTIIILVIFVVVLVFMLNDDLFHIFYNDGSVSASQLKEGDVVSYFAKDSKKRYMKLGEANEVEGLTRSTTFNNSGAPYSYTYTPDESTDNLEYITLSGTYVSSSSIVDSTISYLEGLAEKSGTYTEPRTLTVQGHDARIFSYTFNYYDESRDPDAVQSTEATETTADAEKKPSNYFCQNITVYVTVTGDHCVAMHIYRSGDDESFYLDADAAEAYAENYYNLFTVNE